MLYFKYATTHRRSELKHLFYIRGNGKAIGNSWVNYEYNFLFSCMLLFFKIYSIIGVPVLVSLCHYRLIEKPSLWLYSGTQLDFGLLAFVFRLQGAVVKDGEKESF